MLRTLLIENYGLIERAEIAFADGATMFTGETGSGKTMLLGALGFVLGERASADTVRQNGSAAIGHTGSGKETARREARASVTLTFDPDPALRARLNDDGFELDPGEEAVLDREMTAAGKSSVRINGRPATAASVRDIAGGVADIVGQHDAQRLLSPKYHLELLDRFGGESLLAPRAQVGEAYAALQGIETRLAALEGDDRRARARYEDARYALEEIEVARIEKPNNGSPSANAGTSVQQHDAEPAEDAVWEDARLTARRRFLDNVERVAEALRVAHDALAGENSAVGRDEANVSSAIGTAGVALHGIAGISPGFAALADRAAALQEEANDLAREVGRELEATEFNPNELEEINGRLDVLDRLKRKYGGSLQAVLAHAETALTTVADFDGRDERLIELRALRETAQRELATAAAVLTEQRHKAAVKLAKQVNAELGDLALASARFDVAFEVLDAIGPSGAENVEFTFAANAGEPLRPLARVASGGELSRVLLALVVVLSKQSRSASNDRQALVFDEIDAGIGGTTATAVAARLGRLAENGQILCVTHLAQIASWADLHYVLEKSERKGTTTISVRELTNAKEREAELARMLSGETHEVALKHARTLLKAGRS